MKVGLDYFLLALYVDACHACDRVSDQVFKFVSTWLPADAAASLQLPQNLLMQFLPVLTGGVLTLHFLRMDFEYVVNDIFLIH